MNEDFVTYELAKKLKEKGYTQEDSVRYDEQGNLYIGSDDYPVCAAPTIPQVLKWLRKKHFIHISTKPYPCEDGIMWMYEIRKFSEYISAVVKNKTGFVEEEQASLAGIEYVLDNLI